MDSENNKNLVDLTKEFQTKVEELDKSKKTLLETLKVVDHARDNLEQEKNRTSAIITSLADGLLVFDEKNRVSLVNPRVEEIFCVKGEELFGKTLPELNLMPSLQPLVKILEEGLKKMFRKELDINDNLILEVTVEPMNLDDQPIGHLIILHEITREKLIEKMKSEFVSVAAHQLRTPITGIKWVFMTLLNGDAGEISKEQEDLLSKGYQSNERMVGMVNDLLNVTKIEEGRFLYKLAYYTLEDLIEKTLSQFSEIVKKKDINIVFEKPEKPSPKIKVDAEKIELVIQNLIDNAIKYSKAGGMVTISLVYDKNEVKVSVKDSGIGIPKEEQSRLFSKFFRAENAVKVDTEGSGLGLFITKNIVEKHGGRIGFQAEEGKGSVFEFALPLENELIS